MSFDGTQFVLCQLLEKLFSTTAEIDFRFFLTSAAMRIGLETRIESLDFFGIWGQRGHHNVGVVTRDIKITFLGLIGDDSCSYG